MSLRLMARSSKRKTREGNESLAQIGPVDLMLLKSRTDYSTTVAAPYGCYEESERPQSKLTSDVIGQASSVFDNSTASIPRSIGASKWAPYCCNRNVNTPRDPTASSI